jgi:hypothetical protein
MNIARMMPITKTTKTANYDMNNSGIVNCSEVGMVIGSPLLNYSNLSNNKLNSKLNNSNLSNNNISSKFNFLLISQLDSAIKYKSNFNTEVQFKLNLQLNYGINSELSTSISSLKGGTKFSSIRPSNSSGNSSNNSNINSKDNTYNGCKFYNKNLGYSIITDSITGNCNKNSFRTN